MKKPVNTIASGLSMEPLKDLIRYEIERARILREEEIKEKNERARTVQWCHSPGCLVEIAPKPSTVKYCEGHSEERWRPIRVRRDSPNTWDFSVEPRTGREGQRQCSTYGCQTWIVDRPNALDTCWYHSPVCEVAGCPNLVLRTGTKACRDHEVTVVHGDTKDEALEKAEQKVADGDRKCTHPGCTWWKCERPDLGATPKLPTQGKCLVADCVNDAEVGSMSCGGPHVQPITWPEYTREHEADKGEQCRRAWCENDRVLNSWFCPEHGGFDSPTPMANPPKRVVEDARVPVGHAVMLDGQSVTPRCLVYGCYNPRAADAYACAEHRYDTQPGANGDPTLKGDVDHDPVDHPSHYTQYEGLEIIDLTEQMSFLEGNVVKYVTRAPFKGNQLQDLLKAEWYLQRRIAQLKSGSPDGEAN